MDFITNQEYDLFIRPDTANPRARLWFHFTVENTQVCGELFNPAPQKNCPIRLEITNFLSHFWVDNIGFNLRQFFFQFTYKKMCQIALLSNFPLVQRAHESDLAPLSADLR